MENGAMGRPPRVDVGGLVYHVLNRANGRMPIFGPDGDYAAFLGIMAEAQDKAPMRVIDYALMPNHWHLVLWPTADHQLSRFMFELTNTHVKRWAEAHGVAGTGHLYQGRYRNFPIQDDRHYLTVCRYVLRNPLRAGLVSQAEAWPWSSLHQRSLAEPKRRPVLSDGPVDLPDRWLRIVNEAPPEKDTAAIRLSVRRGQPYGDPGWTAQTVRRLGLESTLRPAHRVRPR
jgi:putative transposase